MGRTNHNKTITCERLRYALISPWVAVIAIALFAGIYVLWAPNAGDLPAHVFRADLWQRVGFSVFNTSWYSGHHIPGYSLLYPPLAALIGVREVGAIAAVTAVALFIVCLRDVDLSRLRISIATWLFASGVGGNLLAGRMPFTLGVAFGVAAVASASLAPRNTRIFLAALCSCACVASSPVAGLFLGVVAVAWTATLRRADVICGLTIAGAAVMTGAAMGVLFPEGGVEPFAGGRFWPALLLSLGCAVLIGWRNRRAFVGACLYCLLLVAMFVFQTPVGGNSVRFGELASLAILALVIQLRSRKVALTLVVVGGLMFMQWRPGIRSISYAQTDPSTHAAFYSEVLSYLDQHARAGDRVEIPFTRNHWEAAYVAPRFALARGWERQMDLKVNPLFYRDSRRGLSAESYGRWLRDNAIAWVALPQTTLDLSAHQEARILQAGVPGLKLVHHSKDWQIWKLRDPAPLVSPPAAIKAVHPNRVLLHFPKAARVVLRVHYSPYWALTRGSGCVGRAADDWTEVVAHQAGAIEIKATLSPKSLLAQKSCAVGTENSQGHPFRAAAS